MITLAIDTCLGACAVAAIDGERVLASMSEAMTRGHQERLAPMTREVMTAAGLAFSDLNRIGVTVGPGSFTGLRVGLAFAKGLALALDLPCIGVGSLEALAESTGETGFCAAVIDAGRGNVYLQQFDGGRAISGPDVMTLEAATVRLVEAHNLGEVTLVGPTAALLSAVSGTARQIALASPDPATVAALAARAPLAPPRPLYLRPPDAKLKAT